MLLVKNLNPFSLSRKISDKARHEMVYMLWREGIPPDFYRYICKEKNFIYLNGRGVGQTGVPEIVGGFIDQGKQNLRMLQEQLAWYKDIFQYVYSHVFPEVYTSPEKRGFDLKSNFHILFKTYRDKQIIWQQSLAKNQRITRTSNQKKRTKTNKSRSKDSMNSAIAKNKRLKTALQNDWLTDAKKQKNRRSKSANRNRKKTKSKKARWGTV